MSVFILPMEADPQVFTITLAGVNYILTCKWNDAADAGWVIDLADEETNTPIVANVPLITGADCLSGLEYLGINGSLFVYTDGDQNAVPNYNNLGVESNLYFVTGVVDNGV